MLNVHPNYCFLYTQYSAKNSEPAVCLYNSKKFYLLSKRYNKIRRFEQRPFVENHEETSNLIVSFNRQWVGLLLLFNVVIHAYTTTYWSLLLMFFCPHCSQLSYETILLSLSWVLQCWTFLLTTVRNLGSKTLFNPVRKSLLQQVVRLLLCKEY